MTPLPTFPLPLSYGITDTSIGTLALVGSDRGLERLHWVKDKISAVAWVEANYPNALRVDGFFSSTIDAINDYLEGKGTLRIPYHLSGGTALQRMVWLAIAKIPYGKTISYTTLAEQIGFGRAVRAVASACGANPLPLIIPCHRVISKDGSLGGFSMGGIDIKEKLLAMELAAVTPAKTLSAPEKANVAA